MHGGRSGPCRLREGKQRNTERLSSRPILRDEREGQAPRLGKASEGITVDIVDLGILSLPCDVRH